MRHQNRIKDRERERKKKFLQIARTQEHISRPIKQFLQHRLQVLFQSSAAFTNPLGQRNQGRSGHDEIVRCKLLTRRREIKEALLRQEHADRTNQLLITKHLKRWHFFGRFHVTKVWENESENHGKYPKKSRAFFRSKSRTFRQQENENREVVATSTRLLRVAEGLQREVRHLPPHLGLRGGRRQDGRERHGGRHRRRRHHRWLSCAPRRAPCALPTPSRPASSEPFFARGFWPL